MRKGGKKFNGRMAFEMAAQAPTNVKSPDCEKYIQELKGVGENGSTLWGVVVPLSLKGGGSIQLGFNRSALLATECVGDYFTKLMENIEEKAVCSGCRDEMANQEAHYGGCMQDPDGE